MNKKLLKKFAPSARAALNNELKSRLRKIKDPDFLCALRFEGEPRLLELATFTWFNRLAALRLVELRGLLKTPDPWQNLPAALEELKTLFPSLFPSSLNYLDLLIPDTTDQFTSLLLELPPAEFSDVEILGWLYQYYHQTEKSRLISAKKPYEKSEIPAVTGLFTPKNIVQFLVDSVFANLTENQRQNPESLKFFDPCCGSGHILVYAFSKLYELYFAQNYEPKEIPAKILEHNLFALDIDPRAVQIATIALLLKASEHDPEIFQKPQKPQIFPLTTSAKLSKTTIQEIKNPAAKAEAEAEQLFSDFIFADEVGSLLIPKKTLHHFRELETYLAQNPDYSLSEILQAHNILIGTYDFVVTNPPYLNSARMSKNLKTYLADHFPDFKRDLFAAFIYRANTWLKPKGQIAMMTPNTWLFTKTFQKLRQFILENFAITNFLQPDSQSFFSEATVEICAFTLQNYHLDQPGNFTKLQSPKSVITPQTFRHQTSDFQNLPDQAILYWLADHEIQLLSSAPTLAEFAEPHQGVITGDNEKFLRYWFEVDLKNLHNSPKNLHKPSLPDLATSKTVPKWLPHNKGGAFQKWYGNREFVIDWSSLDQFSRPQNLDFQFRPSLSWSSVTTGDFSARLYDETFTFNSASPSCFPPEKDQFYLLGLLNSSVAQHFTKILNPTLNLNAGDLAKLPVIISKPHRAEVEQLVQENLDLAKALYGQQETSPDFQTDPLVKTAQNLRQSSPKSVPNLLQEMPLLLSVLVETHQSNQQKLLQKLAANEAKIDQIFQEIYRLPNIRSTQTIQQPLSEQQLIKNLLSFAVGSYLGRYSNGPSKVSKSQKSPNLLDLSDLAPIENFLAATFGADTLPENLAYIEKVLKMPLGTYFKQQFFADHCQIFRHCPIYFQLSSATKNPHFSALFSVHRFRPSDLDFWQQILAQKLMSLTQKSDLLNQKIQNTPEKLGRELLQRDLQKLAPQISELENFSKKLQNLPALRLNLDLGTRKAHARFGNILKKLA